MAVESSAVVGSGISALRETQNVRAVRGSNSVIANYEDVNSCLGIMRATSLAVDTTAEQITPADTRLRGRRKMLVQNLGGGNVFLGGTSDVTSSTGYRIASGGSLELDVLDYGNIWIIGDAAADVRILELK